MNQAIDLNRRKVELFGINIHNVTLDEAVKITKDLLLKDSKPGRYVVTPNATQIVQIKHNSTLRRIFNQAYLVVADGMPVIWASRFLGKNLKERVTGADLFPKLCKIAANCGIKVFLLGAKPGVADKAASNLKSRHPHLKIAGVYSPPFGFEDNSRENKKIIRMIKNSKADILFVALGFPKQEMWIYKHAEECDVNLSIGVGAAFDFQAGTLGRAPGWMQRWGLEWFHRLLQEPGRLWYRYLIKGPQFILLTLREFIKTKVNKF